MPGKTKTISGTITGGYTLSPKYQALSVTSSGEITGAAGASGQQSGGVGGSGVDLPLGGTVENSGSIIGGLGGSGTVFSGYGGAGVSLAASGAVLNGGWIVGGASQYNRIVGGAGGEGVVLASGGFVSNSGWIVGGAGGGDPSEPRGVGGAGVALLLGGSATNTGSITGGQAGANAQGGAGVLLASGGTISNTAWIAGGAGGALSIYSYASGGAGAALTGGVLVNSGSISGGVGGKNIGPHGHGGYGGVGVSLASGANLANGGTIAGGAGGASGTVSGVGGSGVLLASGAAAYLDNTGLIIGGASGAGAVTGNGGAGVYVQGSGDTVSNSGSIIGGARTHGGQRSGHMGYGILLAGVGDRVVNGSKASNAALIYGYIGVGSDFGRGVVTLVNYGTVKGAGGTSVQFDNVGDRLIVEAGSTFLGTVRGGSDGGYGTLELASATGTIKNLGNGDGTLSGATAMTFSEFRAYQIDAGGSWAVADSGGLFGKTLINYGTLIGNLSLPGQDRMIAEAGSSVIGRVNAGVAGAYSVLELASANATLTGLGNSQGNVGTISGGVSMTVSGFGVYQIDAGGYWTLAGKNTLFSHQTMINAGTLSGTLSLAATTDRLIMAGGAIVNGVVAGGRGRLELEAGAGTITGLGGTATLSGADAMSFSGFGSFQFDAGGDWTLVDGNALGGGRTLIDDGTLNGGLTLSNAKSRLVLGAGAVVNGAVAGAGGTLELASGSGTITGSGGAETVSGAISMSGGGFGTLDIDAGASWTFSGTNTFANVSVKGTVTNAGTLDGGISLASRNGRLIMEAGSVVTGNVVGDANGPYSGTLELAAGVGTIGQAANFTGFAVDQIDAGGAWSLVGSDATSAVGSIIDNGSLTIDAGVTLMGFSNASGAGDLTIGAGATLVLETSAAKSLTLTFGGAGATLELGIASEVSSTLSGFTSGETIDLLRQAATAASVNGQDQLVVVDGSQTVATLQLTGNYAGQSFNVASDGAGGSLITVSGGGASRSPAHFAQAMAGVSKEGAGAGISLREATFAAGSPRLLSPGAPHAETA